MKKYYQVLLVLISLLSITALIFYRHEYHRLRYVLEVLNFFGDPEQESKHYEKNCLTERRNFNMQVGVSPSWQRVTNRIYVYSAFWDYESQLVKAVAVNNGSLDLLVCNVWFTNLAEPWKGTVRILSDNLEGSTFFSLACEPPDDRPGVPLYAAFSLVNDSFPGAMIAVFQNHSSRNTRNESIVVCTVPSFVTSTEAVGFFAYHQLIGVTGFIVYGQPQFQGLNILNVPWNFPFPGTSLVRPGVDADCYLRAQAAGASYAVTLSWNQYVVPRYHRSLQNLFGDYTESGEVSNFEIDGVDFCTEISDSGDTISKYSMLPLQKTHRRSEVFSKPIVIHSTFNIVKKTQRIPNRIASLHNYLACFKNGRSKKGQVIHDPVFRRFDPYLQEALKFWTDVD